MIASTEPCIARRVGRAAIRVRPNIGRNAGPSPSDQPITPASIRQATPGLRGRSARRYRVTTSGASSTTGDAVRVLSISPMVRPLVSIPMNQIATAATRYQKPK